MSKYSIKTYVNAAIKPSIVALKNLFIAQITYITNLSKRQDQAIVDMQSKIIDLNTKIIEYKTEVLRLNDAVTDLIDKFPDLRDSVSTLDTSHPFMYPVDLETTWRMSHNLSPYVRLTDTQLSDLRTYVTEYYRIYPNREPPEDLKQNHGGSLYVK